MITLQFKNERDIDKFLEKYIPVKVPARFNPDSMCPAFSSPYQREHIKVAIQKALISRSHEEG